MSKIKYIEPEYTDSEFQVFADLHPIEAFKEYPKQFCDYFRHKTGVDFTDEKIRTFVENLKKDNHE